MKLTAVAKSYMNQLKPQSSKSMIRRCASVRQQVREPQVGVHQAEALGARTEALEAPADERQRLLR